MSDGSLEGGLASLCGCFCAGSCSLAAGSTCDGGGAAAASGGGGGGGGEPFADMFIDRTPSNSWCPPFLQKGKQYAGLIPSTRKTKTGPSQRGGGVYRVKRYDENNTRSTHDHSFITSLPSWLHRFTPTFNLRPRFSPQHEESLPFSITSSSHLLRAKPSSTNNPRSSQHVRGPISANPSD